MTKIGASIYLNDVLVEVTSIGTGFSDGWVRVALLPQSSLPAQSGADSYVFTAWCSIGSTFWPGGVSLSQNAVCEVALGTDVAPFTDQRHRVLLSEQRLYGGTTRQLYPMAPVWWTMIHAVGIRAQWPSSTRGVGVWARISANGDSLGLVSGSSFRVANIGIQAWSLTSLASTQYVIERYAPTPFALSNVAPGNLFKTAQVGQFQGTGTWLVFGGVRYWPGTHAPPTFRFAFTPDGTYASWQPGFGRGNRFGTRARYVPQGGFQTQGRWDQQCGGGMFVRENPQSAGQIALLGYDPNGTAGGPANCGIAECDVFAIKGSAVLGNFDALQQDDPDVANFYNGRTQSPVVYEGVEWGRPFDADTEVFFNSSFSRPNVDPSYHHTIETNVAGSIVRQIGAVAATPNSDQHGHIGTRYRALRPGEIQFKFYAQQATWESAAPLTVTPYDFAAAAWSWENNPNFTPFPRDVDPGTTYLIPDRESLAVGSLTALPIAPDVQVEETFEVARSVFEASDGTRITWPKWLGVRRSFAFTWSGQTVGDRAVLAAFFLANRSFKWTPPDETAAVALAIVGEVMTEDVGVLHTIRVQAIELVWTGSGA